MCTRGVLICTKYGLRTRETKMIDQKKPRRNAPCKWFKQPWGHDFLSLLMSLSTILLFFHLTNTLLVSLKSICCIGYNKYDSVLCLVAQSCLTLCDLMGCSPPGSSVHWYSPGKNTGVGCHGLLQGIFPTQGSNPGLLHCRWILYRLNHQGRQCWSG